MTTATTTRPIVHEPSIQYVGDDWILRASVLAPDGQPLSLLDETLEWVLGDKGGLNQVIAPTNVTITETDAANGLATIRVPSEITERLAPGRYIDALRTTDVNGDTRTLWTGVIYVERMGFYAPGRLSALQMSATLAGASDLYADATVS